MLNNGLFPGKRLSYSAQRIQKRSIPSIDSLILQNQPRKEKQSGSQFFLSKKTARPQTQSDEMQTDVLSVLNTQEDFETYNKDVHFSLKLINKTYVRTMPTRISTQQSFFAKSQPSQRNQVSTKNRKTINKTTNKTTQVTTTIKASKNLTRQPSQIYVQELDIFTKPISHKQSIIQEFQSGLDNEPKKYIKPDPLEIKKLYEELAYLDGKFEKMIADTDVFIKNIYADKSNCLKVKDNVLTDQELIYVVQQLKQKNELISQMKTFEVINFEEIDKIISKLVFFERFTKSTRMNLIKLSQYIEVPPGEYVFHQGDYGDNLFVILSGSVVVKVEKKFQDVLIEQVVSSLYDGQHFGELAMMETTQKGQEDVLEEKLENINVKSLEQVKTELIKKELIDLGEQSQDLQRQKMKELQISTQDLQKIENQANERHYIMRLDNDDKDMLSSNGLVKSSNIQYKKVEKAQQRKASIQASETCHLIAISRDNFKNILMVLMQDELEQKIKMLKSLRFFKSLQPFVLIPLANQLIPQRFHLDEVLVKEGDTLEFMYILYKGSCNVIRTILADRIKLPQDIQRKNNRKSYKYLKEHPLKNDKQDQIDYLSCLTQDGDITYKIPDFAVTQNNTGYIQYQKSYIYKRLFPGDIIFGRVLTGFRLEGDKGTDKARMTVVSTSSQTIVYKINQKLIQFCPEFLTQHLINQLIVQKEIDFIEPSDLNKQLKQLSLLHQKPKDQWQIMAEQEEKRRKMDLQEFYKRNKIRKPQNEKKQDIRNEKWEQFKEEVVIDQLLFNNS